MTYFTQRILQNRILRSQFLNLALISLVLIALQATPASAQWTTNGNNINNTNTGNVGIGTTVPDTRLTVVGSGTTIPTIYNFGDVLTLITPNDNFNAFSIAKGGVTNPQGITIGINHASLYSEIQAARMGVGTNALILNRQGGNVGIGTTSPGQRLSVAGTVESTSGGFKFPDGSVQTTAAGGAQSIFKDIANGSGTTQFSAGSTNDSLRFEGTGGTSVSFDANNKKVIINSSGGGGGGGTITGVTAGTGLTGGGTTGTVALTNNDKGSDQFIFKNVANVAGTTQFSAASNNDAVRFAGTGGTTVSFDTGTKKITVDSSGITSSQWTTSGGNINYASGNVGIGITPTEKLHVAGNGIITGNLTVDGNIAAKYQDVAEWVPASHALPAGTVVTLDPTKSNHVEASSKAYDTRVAGVISEQPGITLGERGDNKVLVATTGRVRLKVDASTGPIQVGDLLVTSDIPGVAMKSQPVNLGGIQLHRPGTLVGKALEPLTKGRGEILVLLSLQ